MRAFSATIVALVLLAATAQASVGVNPDNSFTASTEKYVMCDKCSTTSTTANFYIMRCNGTKTSEDSYATIDYDCTDSTCSTCTGSVAVTMGSLIKASYASYATYFESSITTTKYGFVAASWACCPKVAITSMHSSSTCDDTDGRKDYGVSGCQGTAGSTSWDGSYCETDGAIPSAYHNSCSSDSPLNNGDACPDTSKCLASLTLTNDPCVKANGVAGLFGNRQVHCQVDPTQMCLRAVAYASYTSNMTNTDPLSGLSCAASGAASATLVMAFAVVAAAVSMLIIA